MKRINCPSCWHPIGAGDTMCERCGYVFVDHKRLGMRPPASEVRAQREANRPSPGEVRKNMASKSKWKPLKQGYAFELSGKRMGWRRAPDDEWEQVIIGPGEDGRLVGHRNIDDVKHAVFQRENGGYVAQMASYVRNARMKSMTYGIVPPYAEFERHVTTWKNEDGEGIDVNESPVYHMEIVGSDAECGQEAAQDIPGVSVGGGRHYAHKLGVEIEDVAALWAFVNSLVHHADDADEEGDEKMADAYRDLASGIMYTLGYEWI